MDSRSLIAALVIAGALTACGDSTGPESPGSPEVGKPKVEANVSGTYTGTVSGTVSGIPFTMGVTFHTGPVRGLGQRDLDRRRQFGDGDRID